MILLFRVRLQIPNPKPGEPTWTESRGFPSRETAAKFASSAATSGRCIASIIDPYHEASPLEEEMQKRVLAQSGPHPLLPGTSTIGLKG